LKRAVRRNIDRFPHDFMFEFCLQPDHLIQGFSETIMKGCVWQVCCCNVPFDENHMQKVIIQDLTPKSVTHEN
jgi:hypothetical protein